MKHIFVLLAILALAPSAFADTPQLYKWTDAAGVIHYSDKPPAQPVADLQSMDMPSFPAPDPAEIAAHQAQLDAEAQTAQKLLKAQLDAEAQVKALAIQQAQLDAALAAAQQQAAPQPVVEPIYLTSAFVPRIYRANLYRRHRPELGTANRPLPDRAIPVLSPPHK